MNVLDTEAAWNLGAPMQLAQAAALRHLFTNGMATDQDVRAFLTWLREPKVSSHCLCGNPEHTPQFRFLADVLTGRINDFLVWANRSGSKSYLAGLITWARSSRTPRLETTVLGGSLEQSEKVYKAMNDIWAITKAQDAYLLGEPTRRMTRWQNGSLVSVLTASTRSTRGPHPQCLIMDEIDEMPKEVYDAAISQPQSKHGIPAMLGQMSTAHKFGGQMDAAVAMARAERTPLYVWCIWDVLEPCLDYQCSTCKLTSLCPGKQMKQADGYYRINDFLQKLERLNAVTLAVEWECKKVGRDDLVYGQQYDPAVHAPQDAPDFHPDLPVLLSIDWGGSNPFSVGVWQPFPDRWWRVDEVVKAHTTNPSIIKECQARPWWPNVRGGVADPSRPDLVGEWAVVGVYLAAADNEVDMGIESVRTAMRPVIGGPKFGVNPRTCTHWMAEVQSYAQKNGKVVKQYDHTMDETRYFVRWQMATGAPRRKGKVYTASKPKPAAGRPAQVARPEPTQGTPVLSPKTSPSGPQAGPQAIPPGTPTPAQPGQPQGPKTPEIGGTYGKPRQGRIYRR